MKNATAEKHAEMRDQFLAGKTLSEIGAENSISRQRVHQILKNLGISGADGGAKKRAQSAQEERKRRLDAYSISSRGMPHDQFKKITKSAKRAYWVQCTNAKKRGIAWEFDFASWWDIWQASGKWEQRGRGAGYVMARYGDAGPYSPSNVYVCSGIQNVKDSYVFLPYSERRKPSKKAHSLTSSIPGP